MSGYTNWPNLVGGYFNWVALIYYDIKEYKLHRLNNVAIGLNEIRPILKFLCLFVKHANNFIYYILEWRAF